MLTEPTTRPTSTVLEQNDGGLRSLDHPLTAWPAAPTTPPVVPPSRTITIALINLVGIAVVVAWLAVACYALDYLASR